MSLLAYLAFLLLLGVVAQWSAWRMKLPSILLLLILGFALSHFTGMRIDNYLKDESSLLSLVGFFVAIILFEGGLTLKFSELKEAGTPVLRLCTIAVVLAFGLTAVAARYTLGYHWQICALLGAILVVTGPTVVAPLLRLIRPRRKVASIVKWEGIVVDPIGAVLAVLVFITIQEGGVGQGWDIVAIALVKTLVVGVGLGWGLAKVTEGLMSRHLIPDFLESMFFLALVGVAFAGSNAIQHEAGLLTVTVLGVALANQKKVSVRHILEFKENLRVLIISLLFLMLSNGLAKGVDVPPRLDFGGASGFRLFGESWIGAYDVSGATFFGPIGSAGNRGGSRNVSFRSSNYGGGEVKPRERNLCRFGWGGW
ncbi:cation:proton antiporter [Akkermansiaceae bacterium]|nr:cation:proton antiporter [Akkermansiaceae bacterium]